MHGYVYFVQPYDMVGTDRYKVGMSALDNLSRAKSYGSGTRYLCILDCPDAALVERELLAVFHQTYFCFRGNEYFVIEHEMSALQLFIETVMSFKLNKSAATPIGQRWHNRFAFSGAPIDDKKTHGGASTVPAESR